MLKRASVDVILEVLDDVHAGELVVRVEAWTDHQAAAGGSTRPEMLAEPLTLREQEVLTKLVGGAGTEVIAREMGIQYSTARTHIQNVLGKLGVHSKVAAVAFAVGSGLVTLAPAEHEAAVRPPLRPPSPQPLRRPPGYFVPRTAWAAAGGG